MIDPSKVASAGTMTTFDGAAVRPRPPSPARPAGPALLAPGADAEGQAPRQQTERDDGDENEADDREDRREPGADRTEAVRIAGSRPGPRPAGHPPPAAASGAPATRARIAAASGCEPLVAAS